MGRHVCNVPVIKAYWHVADVPQWMGEIVMATTESAPSTTIEAKAKACPCWMIAALVVSLIGTAGGLALTWMAGLTACTLCFYQRVFMMGTLGVLLMGTLVRDIRPGRASLLAFPTAMGGFAIAVFHVSLEMRGKLECPTGLMGLGTAPMQSLVLFTLLLLLLGGDLIEARKAGHGLPAVALGAGVLGLLFAVALIFSGPPLPVYSDEPAFQKRFKYPDAPVECRPPRPA